MVESPVLETYLARIADLAPLVREHAATSERDGRLATPIVEALHEAGLFRVLLPPSLGGGGLTIPESIVVFEAMARLDASVAWNLAICADGPLFGHFLSREAYETVFDDPRAVVAGTLNPLTIRAVRCDGGWRYSGRANYVSGSAQATWLVGAGIELHDDEPRMVEGFPIMRAAIMPFRHCTILDTWHVSGMRGTGSNDCTFEDVFVPDDFTFAWPEARSPWCTGAFGTVPPRDGTLRDRGPDPDGPRARVPDRLNRFGVAATEQRISGARVLSERRDHVVGVAPQVVDLLGERRVRHVIGVAEANDDVRDAEILEHANAVGRVGVQGDHMDLERLPLPPTGTSKLRQTPEIPDQEIMVPSRVHPPVAQARRTTQRRLGVAADQDGYRRRRHRTDLDARYPIVRPLELEVPAAQQAADDVDHLVHPLAARRPLRPRDGEVLRPG
jgi:hypothetical protein